MKDECVILFFKLIADYFQLWVLCLRDLGIYASETMKKNDLKKLPIKQYLNRNFKDTIVNPTCHYFKGSVFFHNMFAYNCNKYQVTQYSENLNFYVKPIVHLSSASNEYVA